MYHVGMIRPKLTKLQINQLRDNILRSPFKPKGKTRRAALANGPLHGLDITIEATSASAYRLAWCHITPTGPVQIIYKPCGPARWCYEGLESIDAGAGYPAGYPAGQ